MLEISPPREDGPLTSIIVPAALHGFDRRRSSRRYRHRELSQLMHDRRGSFLSTASLALAGVVPRRTSKSSTPDRTDGHYFLEDHRPQGVWRRTKQLAQYLYEKTRLKYLLPLLILVGYSVIGGAVIYWIEAPIEYWQLEGKQRFLDDQKLLLSRIIWEVKENRTEERRAMMTLKESVYWYTITTLYTDGNFTRMPPSTADVIVKVQTLRTYTNQMAERCWEIRKEIRNLSDAQRKVDKSLRDFEKYTRVPTEVKPTWTYSNALFLAVTIYTTIGYGSVAPHTVAGRVATIIYAIIGIPIYVIIIHRLGRVFLKLLDKFWKFILRLTRYVCRRRGMGRRQLTRLDDENGINNIPVSLAVGVTFGWMLTCAGICCLVFETSWDYFTSFYFIFISLTTIGLGDVTPTKPEYMFTMFGLIIVGLSLVSMCINVVQLKLELLFEEMMLALMEEYEKTGQLIDPDVVGEAADFQRGGLGFSQIFKLWKKKRAVRKNSIIASGSAVPILPATGIFLPLMARKQRASLLIQLQRRARERTIGTQTDRWNGMYDTRIREHSEREKGTQTDNRTGPSSSSLITCSSNYHLAEEEGEELFHSDLSVYSDIGCPHPHSMDDLGLEPCRPWSSMANAPPPIAHKSLRACDKHISTPEVWHIDQRRKSKGIFRPYEYKTPSAGQRLRPAVSYYYRTSPTSFADHPQLDHGRYWLAGLEPSAPPGGGVPAMFIRRETNEPGRDEMKTLMKEIGCRLDACRHILQQKQEEHDPK